MRSVNVENDAHTNTNLDPQSREALLDLLLQLADDDLVHGHRSSEWLGLAPDLEEDIAFSSISQDEVGHAAFYYGLIAQLTGQDENELAFARPGSERRNARLLEQPNGDWAETIVRSYFYDTFEQVRLEALLQSTYQPLVQGAAKILREERYHLLHMKTWFERLLIAGGEASLRMQEAITRVWADLGDLFSLGASGHVLSDSGIFPATDDILYQGWKALVQPVFDGLSTSWPGDVSRISDHSGRLGNHTQALDELLATMTEVYRSDTAAKW